MGTDWFHLAKIGAVCCRLGYEPRASQTKELANLLENRFLTGGLGIFFESWLFESLGDGHTLTVHGASGAGSDAYVFEGMRIMMISCNSLEMNLNSSIIYKLDRATFPSIEGYALVETELLFLQSTVSETHRDAKCEHAGAIIALADRTTGQNVTVRVIYIVLSSVACHNA